MKVLIATDGSPWSHEAIREAARLLVLKDAEVHVVSVASLVPLMAGYESTFAVSELVIEQEVISAKVDASKAVALLAELGVSAVAHDREGEAAQQILALGHEIKPDLIVLGAHGKNLLERIFMGSTSDSVIHQWGGAVLVIRPRHDHK